MIPQRKNIAILSAGRRVELVQAFMEQQTRLLPGAKVYALDVNPSLSSACQIADVALACPRADAPEYSAFLTAFFAQHDIGLAVPTIDTELMVLAQNRLEWAKVGSHISVSNPEIIGLCRDKRQSGQLFAALGIRYPELFDARNTRFPAFLKPVSGSSSKGARIVLNQDDLGVQMPDSSMMLMEYIGPPYIEYSIDAYFDQNSHPLAAVPRKRIETRAGEISKGITAKGELYRHLIASLANWQGVRGCITLQVFYNQELDDIVGLEVNPRFGGGFPLSYSAGAHYPGWLIQEYIMGQTPEFYDSWEDKLLMLRYDAKVLVRHADA
jgi:carbamoyl-phosphate synthase large subunit